MPSPLPAQRPGRRSEGQRRDGEIGCPRSDDVQHGRPNQSLLSRLTRPAVARGRPLPRPPRRLAILVTRRRKPRRASSDRPLWTGTVPVGRQRPTISRLSGRDQQVDRSDHSIAGVDRDLLRGGDGGVPCRPQACPDVSERFRRHLDLCPAEAPPFRMRKGLGLMVEAGPLRGLRVQRPIPRWHRTTAPTPARWQDRL